MPVSQPSYQPCLKSGEALFKSSYQNSRTAQKLNKQKPVEANHAAVDASEFVEGPESEQPVETVTRKTLDLIKDIDFDLKDQPGVVAEIAVRDRGDDRKS